MRRRRFLSLTGGALAAGAVGLAGASGAFSDDPPQSDADETNTAVATLPTATIVRGDLGTDREFRASISFGEPWTVTTTAAGTVTMSRPAGAVVDFGDHLVTVDDKPLFLGAGTVPLYRELHRVDTGSRDANGDRLELQKGFDVAQLQAFLLGSGHLGDLELEADATFGRQTEAAVKAWQRAVGHSPTGRVDSSQVVFSPEPLRLTTALRVGAPFQALEVSRATSAVLVDTSNRDRGALSPGTAVTIEVAGSEPAAGVCRKQEQTAGTDGSRVWRTTIDATDDLHGEAGAATVHVTELLAQDVLLVPASALLALAEGGFAVEVPTPGGTRLVGIDVGEVLDGRAEISGRDVAEGGQVVIPT